MEKVTCSQLRIKLAEIKDLKKEFDLEMIEVEKVKQNVGAKELSDRIVEKIKQIIDCLLVFNKSKDYKESVVFLDIESRYNISERKSLGVLKKMIENYGKNSADFEYVNRINDKNGHILKVKVEKIESQFKNHESFEFSTANNVDTGEITHNFYNEQSNSIEFYQVGVFKNNTLSIIEPIHTGSAH